MKIIRANRRVYFYMLAFILTIVIICSIYEDGLQIDRVETYILIILLLYLLLGRDKIKIFEDHVEIYCYFSIRKKAISYKDIKTLLIGEYKMRRARKTSPLICILDKEGNEIGYFLYKFYSEDEIKELVQIIKNKNKKVKVGFCVENLFNCLD